MAALISFWARRRSWAWAMPAGEELFPSRRRDSHERVEVTLAAVSGDGEAAPWESCGTLRRRSSSLSSCAQGSSFVATGGLRSGRQFIIERMEGPLDGRRNAPESLLESRGH